MTQKINRILIIICAYLLGIMVIVASWQVISRYIFNHPSSWTEEILRFSLIWLTMLGTPLAHGLNRNMSVTFLVNKFSNKNKYINSLFVEILTFLLALVVLLIGGWMVAVNAYGQVSAALGINMFFVYISLPISGILLMMYSGLKIKMLFKTRGDY